MGGPPNVVMAVRKHLNHLGIDDHLVVCGQTRSSFAESVRELEFMDPNMNVYFSKRDSIYGKMLNFFEMKDLLKYIYGADIVILHQIYNFQNIFAAIFCRILNKKYVLMPHGSLTQYQSEIHKKRKFLAHLLIFNQIIKRSQSIFVATDVEKEQILSRYATRVDKVGIGLSHIPEIPNIYVEKPRNRFLFLGRIAQKKRIDLTLKAFEIFALRNPSATLTIVGDGDQQLLEELIMSARCLQSTRQIEFIPWVSGEEKESLFRTHDFFILNSEDENFAIAVAEAQSFGLPVLISKFVAFSEVVDEFSSGVVVNGLEIQTLVKGMEKISNLNYAQLVQHSLLAAKSVSWDLVIRNWVHVLSEIASE